jgi:hypothetical protein
MRLAMRDDQMTPRCAVYGACVLLFVIPQGSAFVLLSMATGKFAAAMRGEFQHIRRECCDFTDF